MSKIFNLLKKNRLTLIVSLPENSYELALSAIEGGADALKVHLNIKHQAAKVKFLGFKEERDKIEKILNISSVPVGIVPGEEEILSFDEMNELISMGIDFFDVKLKYLKEWMLSLKGIGKIVSMDENYTLDEILGVSKMNVDAIEAAIVPPKYYWQNLTVGDIQQYISICLSSNVPVIIPTQKKIEVSEVPIILDLGAKALMIGAVVTGKSARSIKEATKRYRAAIDSLG